MAVTSADGIRPASALPRLLAAVGQVVRAVARLEKLG